MNAFLKALLRIARALITDTVKAFLLPLSYAISAWISVWTLHVLADGYEFLLRTARDPAAHVWKRALAGVVGVVCTPTLLPSWAARRVWNAIQQATGFGLDNCDPFPHSTPTP